MKKISLIILALVMSVASFAIGAITGPASLCVGTTITLADTSAGGTWSSSNLVIATVGTSSGIVTGVSAGTSIITYRTSGGFATTVIAVYPTPPAITGPGTVCPGSVISLSDAAFGGAWSSSNSSVASVNSASGIVTGISNGSANIYYTYGSCAASHLITVSGPSSISGPSYVCVGSAISLTDSVGGGTWSSGSTTVATVGSGSGLVFGVAPGVTNIYYSVSGCGAFKSVTVTPLPSVITGSSTVCTGSTITLADAMGGGIWSSSNTLVATVGATSGVVTGGAAGTLIIYYTIGSCSVSKTITVTSGASVITGPSTLCIGSSITLSDTASGGTWSSSNAGIATVSSGGIVTALTAGTVNIYYIVGSCGAYHTVTVTPGTPAISGPSTVCTGTTITLSDSTAGGTWLSSTPGVATVSSGGVVTGIAAGTTTIYYTAGGCTAYRTITVSPAVAAIAGPSSLCVGTTITLTDAAGGGIWASGEPFIATVTSGTGVVTGIAPGTATITYTLTSGCRAVTTIVVTSGTTPITGPTSICMGSTAALTDATSGGMWSSSNTSVITVGATSGVITGISRGTATIYYTIGGCAAALTVTVNMPLPITGPASVCVGSTITLSDSISGGTWISGNTTLASVSSASGVVTGIATGVVNIYYSVGGCGAFRTVTVTPAVAAVSGASSVCGGSTITLSDAASGGVWSSSNPSVATVSSGGIVTGISNGVVNIYYTVGGCSAFKTVTVNAVSAISGPSVVCIGGTISLSDSSATGGTWLSGNTTIATVSSSGVVTGVSAGVVNIYYSAGGCGAYRTVTVTAAPAAITGTSAVCAGTYIVLSDATAGGSWISSNMGIATVGSSGVVTGIAPGVVNIYYSLGSCSVYKIITVNPAPAIISGASTVCVGSGIALSDTTSGGTWYSGNTSIATVSTGGIATGISAGTTNIYYTTGGCSAYHSITVIAAPAAITGYSTVCVGNTITLSDATTGGSWLSGSGSIATVGSASGVVTAVSAGVTNIYYSLGSCGAYKTVTVTAGPAAISGPAGVCVSHTITLTDATGGGMWSSGSSSVGSIGATSGIVTGVAPGTTTITYTVGSGCRAYATVAVYANPVVSTITGPSAVSIGGHITLADVTSGGVWSSTMGSIASVSSGGVVTGISAGSAYIIYTVTNTAGCTAYTGKVITVGPTTPGAGNLQVNAAASAIATVQVVPNPNKGEFIVTGSTGNIDESATIEVVSMVGQVVYKAKVGIINGTINEKIALGSNVASGMYIINLRSENQNQVIRFVIEK